MIDLVLEYVDGGDLQAYVARANRKLSEFLFYSLPDDVYGYRDQTIMKYNMYPIRFVMR